MVVADPVADRQRRQGPVLLSDDADQYLKGNQTGIEHLPAQGTLTIAADGEAFDLTATSPAKLACQAGDIVRANGGALPD